MAVNKSLHRTLCKAVDANDRRQARNKKRLLTVKEIVETMRDIARKLERVAAKHA